MSFDEIARCAVMYVRAKIEAEAHNEVATAWVSCGRGSRSQSA